MASISDKGYGSVSKIIWLSFMVGSLNFVYAADYETLITQARDQLGSNQPSEALKAADEAVLANPTDYKGYYYTALAYISIGKLDNAELALNKAKVLVPAGNKGEIEKVALTLKTYRQIQNADNALSEGLVGKAARLYEEAWNIGNESPEAALKAAELHVTRLTQPVDAARLLRQIKASGISGPVFDKANSLLQEITPTLIEIAKSHVKKAESQSGADALASLQKAQDADPDLIDIYTKRANIVAVGDNIGAMKEGIKDLSKHNLAEPEMLEKLPNIAQWVKQPQFNEFLYDLIGKTKTESLLKILDERKNRYEKAIADYKTKLANYEKEVAAVEQQKKADVVESDLCTKKCTEKHGGYKGYFADQEKLAICNATCIAPVRTLPQKPVKPVESDYLQ
ncbi:MAG: hypothetical protein PHW64_00930 [Sulfuricurvum sp.]|nr:hypothetical protein [Sulfuricurvum sp.]